MARESQQSRKGWQRTATSGTVRPRFMRPSFMRGSWLALGRHYPFIFWSAVWTLLVVMAAIAMSGLINPDLSQPIPIEGAVTVPRPQGTVPSRAAATSPVWLFGALVAACGLGCYALAQRFKGAPQGRSRLARVDAALAAAEKTATEKLGLEVPIPLAKSLPPPSNLVRPDPPPHHLPVPPVLPAANAPMPPINAPALPASDRPPLAMPDLERQTPGLTELLDIQRRRRRRSPPPRP